MHSLKSVKGNPEFLGAIFFNFVNRLYEHTDDSQN